MSRVLVAMSGGVDSAVAAMLLVERGHDVLGVTFNQWPKSMMAGGGGNGCCTPRTIDDARHVSRLLGIPHYVVDYRREFEAAVIGPWVHGYLRGQTPNPCVECNRTVRFGTFLGKADELGAEFIATGHYARIRHDSATGRYRLLRSHDPAKDQTYVLHVLSQRQLARTLFPLGELTKPRVREIAGGAGLPVAHKPDSQEICFVPDNDYVKFVRGRGSTGQGAIVDTSGARLGSHSGLEQFTVGQRRGLNLGGAGGSRYVVSLDPIRNTVVVGGRSEASARRLELDRVAWIAQTGPTDGTRVDVMTRSRMTPEPARVKSLGRGRAGLAFDQPTWAPAPGQSAVMYRGDEVLGGGTIATAHSS